MPTFDKAIQKYAQSSVSCNVQTTNRTAQGSGLRVDLCRQIYFKQQSVQSI